MNATDFLLSPIIPLFLMLMCIAFIFIVIAFMVNGEIIISPIKGFMVGALVHNETYTENNEKFTEYTLQCLLGIISVNVLWRKQDG
jgi:membrane-bound ClpP family serine protease